MASATIACQTSVLVARAKMTQGNIKKYIPPEPVGSGDKELAEFANQLLSHSFAFLATWCGSHSRPIVS